MEILTLILFGTAMALLLGAIGDWLEGWQSTPRRPAVIIARAEVARSQSRQADIAAPGR